MITYYNKLRLSDYDIYSKETINELEFTKQSDFYLQNFLNSKNEYESFLEKFILENSPVNFYEIFQESFDELKEIYKEKSSIYENDYENMDMDMDMDMDEKKSCYKILCNSDDNRFYLYEILETIITTLLIDNISIGQNVVNTKELKIKNNTQTNLEYLREKVRTNLYKVTYYSKELSEHKEIRVRSWKVLDKDTVEEFIRDSFQELYSNTYGYDCLDYEETFDFYEELNVDLIDDDENQFNVTYLKISIDPELGTLIYNK